MNTEKRYSPEFRDRAVRLVDEQVKEGKSQWTAMQSISQKLGCTPEILRRWVRRVERDAGDGNGILVDIQTDKGSAIFGHADLR